MKIIPCTEATFLISKRQEAQLRMREWLDLLVHLFVCKFCRRFFEQTKIIMNALRNLRSDERLTPGEKRTLQESLGLS